MSSAFDTIHEIPVPIVGEPVHRVIVPEDDLHHFGIYHPHHVSLISSPLASPEDMAHGHHTHSEIKGAAGHEESEDHDNSDSSTHSSEKREALPDEPVLKRPHEAPTIQLFFDLYFVANLTTFSGQHEIHDPSALRSYIGYFTMIWFTWFQNTLCDVRFSNDSVVERFFKVAQFGIMTGFAIAGPGYQTGYDPDSGEAVLALSAYQTLTLILMTSRLILTAQYSVAFFWLKSYKQARLPMLAHIATMFCSAIIFLGIYFAFSIQGTEVVLVGWYVTFVAEALIILGISGQTPFLRFRNTILTERLGLLTLIILGEGIISMSNALNSTVSDNHYGAPVIGQIICCVAVAYLIYMLYFDSVQPHRMGAWRQHFWALLHFPFHVSIVLIEEAMAQMAIWQKFYDLTNPLIFYVTGVDPTNPTADQVSGLQNYVNIVNGTFLNVTEGFTTLELSFNNTDPFEVLKNATEHSGSNVTDVLNDIYSQTILFVCEKFKIDAPDGQEGTAIDRANAVFNLFEIVFVYFFAFAGSALINLSILFLLGKKRKLRGELLGSALRFCAGLTLCMLSTMAAPSNTSPDGNDNFHRYMYSGWVLPTVLIVYLFVLVTDNLLVRYVKRVWVWRRQAGHEPETEKIDHSAKSATPRPASREKAAAAPAQADVKSPTTSTAPAPVTEREAENPVSEAK